MSILIKGMAMPKNCMECPIVVCLKTKDDCPLISVHPHGRLIDADAILNDKGMGTQIAGWGKMYHETVIEYAPTIIEAEEGET